MGGGRIFDPDARDGVTEPFIRLRSHLAMNGYELRTADDAPLTEDARVWFWNVPTSHRPDQPWPARLARRAARRVRHRRDLLGECLARDMRDRIALFLGEPPVTWPLNARSDLIATFPTVLTWDDGLVDGDRYRKLHLPLPASSPRLAGHSFRDRALLVCIAANKRSSHPSELYSARRATIRYWEHHAPDQFALYGPGWDRPDRRDGPWRSWRGLARHKWEVFPSFRFGLCYENMAGAPGYVTEKLFDCMRGGAVPVYLGAPNVADYVDPATFVDRTAFTSEDELARHLADMPEQEFNRMREAADDYLNSDRFRVFLPDAFVATVTAALLPARSA